MGDSFYLTISLLSLSAYASCPDFSGQWTLQTNDLGPTVSIPIKITQSQCNTIENSSPMVQLPGGGTFGPSDNTFVADGKPHSLPYSDSDHKEVYVAHFDNDAYYEEDTFYEFGSNEMIEYVQKWNQKFDTTGNISTTGYQYDKNGNVIAGPINQLLKKAP
jgi:hypothetical protein